MPFEGSKDGVADTARRERVPHGGWNLMAREAVPRARPRREATSDADEESVGDGVKWCRGRDLNPHEPRAH